MNATERSESLAPFLEQGAQQLQVGYIGQQIVGTDLGEPIQLALGILASASLGTVPIIEVAVRVLGLRAGNGSLDAPILPGLDDGGPLTAIENAK